MYTVLVLYVKNSVITKIAFTFSDDDDDDEDDEDDDDDIDVDAPTIGCERDPGDDDDDNDHPIAVPLTPSVLNREFNDEFVVGLLRSTFNTFHSCAELGLVGLKMKNGRLLKRHKRDRVLSRQKRLAPLLMFGAPAVAAGLIISKFRVITPIQKKY